MGRFLAGCYIQIARIGWIIGGGYIIFGGVGGILDLLTNHSAFYHQLDWMFLLMSPLGVVMIWLGRKNPILCAIINVVLMVLFACGF